jgi:hypothetical protein
MRRREFIAFLGSATMFAPRATNAQDSSKKVIRIRLQHRELRRFGAFENPSGIDTGLTIGIGEACRVADQTAGCDIVTRIRVRSRRSRVQFFVRWCGPPLPRRAIRRPLPGNLDQPVRQ